MRAAPIIHRVAAPRPFRIAQLLVITRLEMTNRIALYIGLTILVILALDYVLGLGLALFLARRFLDLISLVAVWR